MGTEVAGVMGARSVEKVKELISFKGMVVTQSVTNRYISQITVY